MFKNGNNTWHSLSPRGGQSKCVKLLTGSKFDKELATASPYWLLAATATSYGYCFCYYYYVAATAKVLLLLLKLLLLVCWEGEVAILVASVTPTEEAASVGEVSLVEDVANRQIQ